MTENSSEKDNNKLRFFDNDGYRPRAACICIRDENEDEVLLITSHRDQSSWIIPGGGIEPNESAIDAAHRELYEEAGVKGKIVRNLGSFVNEERKHRTTVFVVFVQEEFDDWDDKRLIDRRRHWYQLKEAFTHLTLNKPSQLPFLQRFLSTSPNQTNLRRQISS